MIHVQNNAFALQSSHPMCQRGDISHGSHIVHMLQAQLTTLHSELELKQVQ